VSDWNTLEPTKKDSGKEKLLGSGLNAGNIGAEIDVIKPALPAQTHAPIAIHFAFGLSRTSFLDRLGYFLRLALHNFSTRRSFIAPSLTP
jgi:hypothetical protein